MIIKRCRGNIIFIITVFILISFSLCFLIGLLDLWWFFVFQSIIFLLFIILVLFDIKTFILSESGCTVKVLFFKKHFLWSDLKTKRIVDVKQKLMGGNTPYLKCVIFSKRNKQNAFRILNPLAYHAINPFKFIIIYFTPSKGTYGYYEVEETEFMAKMEEWGVELSIDPECKFLYKNRN